MNDDKYKFLSIWDFSMLFAFVIYAVLIQEQGMNWHWSTGLMSILFIIIWIIGEMLIDQCWGDEDG